MTDRDHYMGMLPQDGMLSVTLAFSCARAKAIQKRNVWTLVFMKTEKKNPRFQTKTVMSGRGLKFILNYISYARFGNVKKPAFEYL